MRVLDLFSGIGGFSLGLERAGMTTVAFCEIDPFCRQVLAKHWPEVPCYDDVRAIPAIGGINLVCGGFPCQPFSVAGKQRGAADDRHLWPAMLEVIRRERPRWVVGENVTGLISLGLDTVLSDLESEAYTCRTFVIPAVAVDAPHRRDRVWIVAHAASDRREIGGVGNDGCLPDASGWQDEPCGDGPGYVASFMADADGARPQGHWRLRERSGEWITGAGREAEHCRWIPEPDVGRGFDGLSSWLDGCVGLGLSHAESLRSVKTLRGVWSAHVSQALWSAARGLERIQQAEVLFAFVREYSRGSDQARLLVAGAQASEEFLRMLRRTASVTRAPRRSKQGEQPAGKYSDAMQVVSQLPAFDSEAPWHFGSWEDGVPRVSSGAPRRVDRLRALGNAVVPQVVEQIGRAIMAVERG